MNTTMTDEEFAKAKARAERKAKLVEVLDRGMTDARLHVDLPSDLYGEWGPNTPEYIAEMEVKGFSVDDKYASKNAIHNDGTTVGRIGDCIHFVCPRENRELIEEIHAETSKRVNGDSRKKERTEQHEEKEFHTNIRAVGLTPIIDEGKSVERTVSIEDVKNIVKPQTA